jgi:uncharacterized membrane protein YgcG
MRAPNAVPLAALSLLVAVAGWAHAQGQAPPPHKDVFVSDEAGILRPEELASIEDFVRSVETRDGVRLAVLTVADARGASPKDMAVGTLNSWEVGRRSVMLLVCMSPRELFIQPGTELAAIFDGPTSSAICHDTVAPRMRSGDRAGAIRAGLEEIVARLHPSSAIDTVARPPMPSTAPPPVPVTGFQREVVGSPSDSVLPCLLAPLLSLGGAAGFYALWQVLRRKCTGCGRGMRSRRRTVTAPTVLRSGQGVTTYTCDGCGFSVDEAYTIAMLSDTSSSISGWDFTSSGDSSSSSFGGGDSGGFSSDGSGGGGSSW